MPNGFNFNGSELKTNLRRFPQEINSRIAVLVDFQSTRAEAYMKTNAPWTDRTSAARSGLFTDTQHDIIRHLIVLAHSVNYGIWLETAKDSKRPIVLPSIKVMGDELMRSLDALLDR